MSATLRLILKLQLGGSGGLEAPPGATIEWALHCKVVPGVTQNPLHASPQCVPSTQRRPRKQHMVKTGIWDCERMQRGVGQRGEIGGEIVRSCAKHSQVTLWWRLFGGLQSLNCTCKLDATKRWYRDCWADFWETVWSEECQTTFKREERHKY